MKPMLVMSRHTGEAPPLQTMPCCARNHSRLQRNRHRRHRQSSSLLGSTALKAVTLTLARGHAWPKQGRDTPQLRSITRCLTAQPAFSLPDLAHLMISMTSAVCSCLETRSCNNNCTHAALTMSTHWPPHTRRSSSHIRPPPRAAGCNCLSGTSRCTRCMSQCRGAARGRTCS